ncbi:MAG: hypothetical protein AB8G05_09220 [Oligoflexales bacterium]
MSIYTHFTDGHLPLSIKFIEKRLALFFKEHVIGTYDCHLFLSQNDSGFEAILELSMLDVYRCEMKVYGGSLSQIYIELLKRIERQIEKMLRYHTPYRDRLRVPAASPWYGQKIQSKPLTLYSSLV